MKFLITMNYGYVGFFRAEREEMVNLTAIGQYVVECDPLEVMDRIKEIAQQIHDDRSLLSELDALNLSPSDRRVMKHLFHVISHSVTQITE